MVGYDGRVFAFCVLLLVVFYAATRRNCFRFVLTDFRADTNRTRPGDTDRRPPCSFSVFRKYLRDTKSHYLPGDGVWTRRGGRRLERFRPDLCSLLYGSWVPRDRLARCFARLNVSFVVILGDSNALRLYKEIRQTLSAAGALRVLNCGKVRHNDVIRPSLPARHCSPIYLALRRFLPPNYFRCNITVAHLPVSNLLVQYLTVTSDLMPLDALLNRTATGCVDNKTSKFVQTQASTVQEFLFGEYFATSPQPDIVLYLSSSWEQSSLSVYANIVDLFVELLRRHGRQLSAGTRLIILARPDEYVPLKPDVWRRRRYQPGNLTRNDWIKASNRILHARLTPLFVDEEFERGPRLLLFPDVAAAMRPVLDELAVDGVHSSSFWYRTLWSFIVQTICSGHM